MPIETYWYDDTHTIVYYHFGTFWTLEELYQALGKGGALMAEVEHPVDSLFDFSDTGHIPSQMLPSIHHVQRNMPENLRNSVAFGVNRFLIMLIQVIQTIAPQLMKDFKLARNRAEALRLLEELRKSKPDAP